MGQPNVKWGHVEKFFLARGYEIRHSGGDKIIVAPKHASPTGTRRTVLIGHNYSDHKGEVLAPGHLSAIKRAFGVTREQILAEG